MKEKSNNERCLDAQCKEKGEEIFGEVKRGGVKQQETGLQEEQLWRALPPSRLKKEFVQSRGMT